MISSSMNWRYYEDIEVGEERKSKSIIITEKEIIEDHSIKSMIEIENNSKFGLFIVDDNASIFCAIDKLEKTYNQKTWKLS